MAAKKIASIVFSVIIMILGIIAAILTLQDWGRDSARIEAEKAAITTEANYNMNKLADECHTALALEKEEDLRMCDDVLSEARLRDTCSTFANKLDICVEGGDSRVIRYWQVRNSS